MLTRLRTQHRSGSDVPAIVLRLSVRARTSIALLLALFDGMSLWLLFYTFARLSSIGLAIFIVVVIAAMTWALLMTIRTKTIITKDEVVLKYSFLPAVRIRRSTIAGVDVRAIAYYAFGGQNTYTPQIVTSDGRKRPVLMMGRTSRPRAEDQANLLRRRLAI